MRHCIREIHFQITQVMFFTLPCGSACDCTRMSYDNITCSMVLKFPKMNILVGAAHCEAIVQILPEIFTLF